MNAWPGSSPLPGVQTCPTMHVPCRPSLGVRACLRITFRRSVAGDTFIAARRDMRVCSRLTNRRAASPNPSCLRAQPPNAATLTFDPGWVGRTSGVANANLFPSPPCRRHVFDMTWGGARGGGNQRGHPWLLCSGFSAATDITTLAELACTCNCGFPRLLHPTPDPSPSKGRGDVAARLSRTDLVDRVEGALRAATPFAMQR
jgi:hypothetical protein